MQPSPGHGRKVGNVAVTLRPGSQWPIVAEIQRVKRCPVDGAPFMHSQIICTAHRWAKMPEAATGEWDETRFGPLVIATKIEF